MIIDARTLPDGHVRETDVCIVGGGVAGLTLAREFEGEDIEVCVLEQGGLEDEEKAQRLNRGEVVGYPYWGLDYTRHAQVGGASRRWDNDLPDGQKGARFRPLDEIDFEQRDEIPHSGWPFEKSHLDTYYDRAQDLFQLGPPRYAAADWKEAGDQLLFDACPSLETVMFQYGPRTAITDVYVDTIRPSDNVTVLHHGTATSLETDETATTVRHVRVATPDGRRFRICANIVILALGGIDNARLLLLSNQVYENGLGNEHDLVGRFFMEHLHMRLGILWPRQSDGFVENPFYHVHARGGTFVHGKLSLREELVREMGLRNSCFSLLPVWDPYDPRVTSEAFDIVRIWKSTLRQGYMPDAPIDKLLTAIRKSGPLFRHLGSHLKKRLLQWTGMGTPPRAYSLHHFAEQVPNPESRVTLSTRKKDRYGRPCARLDWELSRDDVRDIQRGLEHVKPEIEREGQWELELPDYNDIPPPGIRGGFHHMGTTRMHEDPRNGVVDSDGRIHGMSNLFITGSSVFPTGGYANPTLTIGALAIRLADHVKKQFRQHRGPFCETTA